MIRRQPTRRRSASSYIVDHNNLADLVWRRCEGCSIAYHIEVAERFLNQEGFDEEDRDAVLAILQRRLERAAERPPEPPPWHPAAAGTICERCGRPYGVHEPDQDFEELTVLCDGSRVRL
jgi:hypothetical protein